MKNFFKKITRDPFVDWFLLVCIFGLAIIFVGVNSLFYYKRVLNKKDDTDSVSTTPNVKIDIKKLNSIVEQYQKKKAIFEQPKMPKIDVRDPSL